MDLNENFLVFLALDRTQGSDAGPIENTEVIEIALGAQQFPLTERLSLFHICTGDVAEEFRLGMLNTQERDFSDARQRPWIDFVSYVYHVRIFRSGRGGRIEMRVQVTMIQIIREDLAAVVLQQFAGIRLTGSEIEGMIGPLRPLRKIRTW